MTDRCPRRPTPWPSRGRRRGRARRRRGPARRHGAAHPGGGAPAAHRRRGLRAEARSRGPGGHLHRRGGLGGRRPRADPALRARAGAGEERPRRPGDRGGHRVRRRRGRAVAGVAQRRAVARRARREGPAQVGCRARGRHEAVPSHAATGARPPATTADVAARVATAASAFVLHEDAARIRSPTSTLPGTGDVVLVVGPEGGMSPEELEALVAAGGRPCAWAARCCARRAPARPPWPCSARWHAGAEPTGAVSRPRTARSSWKATLPSLALTSNTRNVVRAGRERSRGPTVHEPCCGQPDRGGGEAPPRRPNRPAAAPRYTVRLEDARLARSRPPACRRQAPGPRYGLSPRSGRAR